MDWTHMEKKPKNSIVSEDTPWLEKNKSERGGK